jgi:hypothetical protein
VARLIAMPSTPNFVSSQFRLLRSVGVTQSPFTGHIKTQEFDAVGWEAQLTLPKMRRTTAVNWQSFFMQLRGPVNVFKFADPDALTNRGTYDTAHLIADPRINQTSVTLSFTASNSRVTAGSSVFGDLVTGDFIHITGPTKPENTGTFKVTNAVSGTVLEISGDSAILDESNVSSCKVRQNVKGASALSLEASTNSATGTILVGDYLQIQGAADSTSNPVQLVQVVENATETSQGGSALNHFSLRIEPHLRADFADGNFAVFTNPKGLFRLNSNVVSWSGDRLSNYNFAFSCSEVV